MMVQLAKMPLGIMGSLEKRHSQKPHKTTTTTPSSSGSSVWYDAHSYMTPPTEMPKSRIVVPAVKRKLPVQSKRPSFSIRPPRTGCVRRKKWSSTMPMARMGRLSQKIQRHVDVLTMPAPRMGPMTVPMAHDAERPENHTPRCASGIRSVITTSDSARMPPPPMPWMVRPTRRTVKLLASAATMAPAPNHTQLPCSATRRPKMELADAMLGCSTQLARRKLVPVQNASSAVPLSCELMSGSATGSVVASSAATSASTHSARYARRNSRVATKGFAGSSDAWPGVVVVEGLAGGLWGPSAVGPTMVGAVDSEPREPGEPAGSSWEDAMMLGVVS
jgi:hypothetical protein